MTGCVGWNDMAGLEGRRDDVEDEKPEVPRQDEDVDEEACYFAEDCHL